LLRLDPATVLSFFGSEPVVSLRREPVARLSLLHVYGYAIQHSRPSSRGGCVQIALKTAPDRFSISVSDEGNGTPLHADTQTSGIGARMIEAFARQIDATITKGRSSAGYSVRVTVPRRADRALNRT
jgi:signal transduction histidine kinase